MDFSAPIRLQKIEGFVSELPADLETKSIVPPTDGEIKPENEQIIHDEEVTEQDIITEDSEGVPISEE